jgi:hypothetical protein
MDMTSIRFPERMLTPALFEQLLALWFENSRLGRLPWTVSVSPRVGASFRLENIEHVVDGIRADSFLGVYRREARGLEKLSFGCANDFGAGHRSLALSLIPVPGNDVQFFVLLGELLSIDWMDYVPEFDIGWLRQQWILRAALEREYSDFWDENDRDLHRARDLANRLPKVLMPSDENQWSRPYRLGWLNYWTAAVADHLGFPDSEKDARIVPLCTRTPRGAWIVKLTDEPLDLFRDDHVDALAWAYRRFDKVGRRPQPKAPKTSSAGKSSKAMAQRDAVARRRFFIRERDEAGQWWETNNPEPILASSREEALRKHFAHIMRGRDALPDETLEALSAAYDVDASELGLALSRDIDAFESEE